MRPYDLLVFDWDGTLVDSIASIVGCTQVALEQVGAAPVPDETIRRTIGLGIRDMVDALIPGCDDAMFEQVCLAYREHWFGGFGAAHEPFGGAAATLAELAAAGYLLAIATAKGRRGLDAELARTGLEVHIHASRTVDEAPPKPHPGMLEDLIEELGARADRTLMIGDTAHDLEMAVNAKTAGLGVLTGSHEREDLERAEAVALLDSVRDLPRWLRARGLASTGPVDSEVESAR